MVCCYRISARKLVSLLFNSRQLEKIIVSPPGATSEILIGEKWENVRELLPEKEVVILTDENLFHYYGDKFPNFPVLKIPPGEENKTLSTIEHLAGKLLEIGLDRSGFILAIGGGVICDLAGFLASIYMRGIRCGYISTSLLSQVDASTGGKNGVDLGGVKNILGVIRQPEFVICDPGMLVTLPEEEYLSGLSEMIKTAIIGDKKLFELIEKNYIKILKREPELLTELITRSVKFKASVVSKDEKETGLRRILNFGHTFGHAIETQSSLKHGMAIACGIELATNFSFEKGYIGCEETDMIIKIVRKYDLLRTIDISPEELGHLIMHDKKKSGNDINFVFTQGLGRAVYEKIPATEIIDFYKRYKDKKHS